MPHIPNTPEALLGRDDSKNPSTTCKGITSSGRPCRRALASPKKPSGRSSGLDGVVAVTEEDGELQEAEFYCWQHKDQTEHKAQAEQQQGKSKRVRRKRSTELYPLQERSSIDTLVQRLGIAEDPKSKRKPRNSDNVQRPQKSNTQDFASQRPPQDSHPEKQGSAPPKRPPRQKQGFLASLCCTASQGDDDYVEVVRHRKRVEQAQAPRPSSAVPPRTPVPTSPQRPTTQHRVSSNTRTNQLLSLLPQNLSPQITSALLAELIKPISAADEEGYIYIFWLTPQSQTSPEASTARSLLSPRRATNPRRISDVMSEYSTSSIFAASTSAPRSKQTIMLKIGRANNITRRMNEWQRQCGYALNLVRWYPYVSSSPSPSPRHSQMPSPAGSPGAGRRESEAVRKVPCVKRVERLIHLELAERQVKKQCEACGKEHREWFEVKASQAGVKGVDETVKRWVKWAEMESG